MDVLLLASNCPFHQAKRLLLYTKGASYDAVLLYELLIDISAAGSKNKRMPVNDRHSIYFVKTIVPETSQNSNITIATY